MVINQTSEPNSNIESSKIKKFTSNYRISSFLLILAFMYFFFGLTFSIWTPPASDWPPLIIAFNMLAGYFFSMAIISVYMLRNIQKRLTIQKDIYYKTAFRLIYLQIITVFIILFLIIGSSKLARYLVNINLLIIVLSISTLLSIRAIKLSFKSIKKIKESLGLLS